MSQSGFPPLMKKLLNQKKPNDSEVDLVVPFLEEVEHEEIEEHGSHKDGSEDDNESLFDMNEGEDKEVSEDEDESEDELEEEKKQQEPDLLHKSHSDLVPDVEKKQMEVDSIQRIMMRTEMLMGEIFRKMDMICHRIEKVEERLTHIEECQKFSYTEYNGEIIKIKEIKEESYYLSDSDVMKALIYQDYRSILYIFKLYYRSIQGGKIFYPIRKKNQRVYEYYYNGKWVMDPNGHYIMKTICKNMQNLFLKYNVIDNKLLNEDQWYSNQIFIMKLTDNQRYQKEILKHIMDEIGMNSN